MTQEELMYLIRNGKSETVEFKDVFDKETIETVSAFSNTRGGKILAGVSDNGTINGFQIGKKTITDLINQICQGTEPCIIPRIETMKAKQKNIVVIEIMEFPLKPVSVKGRCYRRVAKSNRLMTPQEIAQIHLSSTGMSWDLLPADNAVIEEIDVEKLKKYIRYANQSGRRSISPDKEGMEILKKLGLLKDNHLTYAAILLFSKDPAPHLTQTVIHCGRFKDEQTIIDDRMIRGTLVEQVDEAMDFMRKHLTVKFSMTGKPKREEIWEYPLEALREALINAVCHRDYSLSANIEIRIYDDKLIISSPGRLPNGLALEDLYKTHSSILRNKGISRIFYDIGLIEQWGSGVFKMRKACKEQGLPGPRFREDNFVHVIFIKNIYTEENLSSLGLNERQIEAIKLIIRKGKITNKEYRKAANLSDEAVRKDLKDLIEKNLIEQKGSGRNIHYTIKQVGDLGD